MSSCPQTVHSSGKHSREDDDGASLASLSKHTAVQPFLHFLVLLFQRKSPHSLLLFKNIKDLISSYMILTFLSKKRSANFQLLQALIGAEEPA
jgi:hypothetical protein